MILSPSYRHMQRLLRQRFLKVAWNGNTDDLYTFMRYFSDMGDMGFFTSGTIEIDTEKVMLVGILFAHPESKIAREHLYPRFYYYNIRSGDITDFFWAGYERMWSTSKDSPHDIGFGFRHRRPYYDDVEFDDDNFNRFRKGLEKMSRWRYSGGLDLILTNAKYLPYLDTGRYNDVHLDFQNAIVCKLDEFIHDGVISNIGEFLEHVFRFAEDDDSDNPAWALSDSKGTAIAKKKLIDWITDIPPKHLGDFIKKVKGFAIQDVSI